MDLEFVVFVGMCIVIGVFAIKMRRISCESKMTASNMKLGRELGMEMRKGLEENWKRHVVAVVVAVGCVLPVVLLKFPPYITFVAGWIFYGIADYALSKLFKKQEKDKRRE